MKKINLIFTLLSLLIITGCSTPNTYRAAKFTTSNQSIYPPVSLSVNDGAYDGIRARYISKSIINSFRKSGLFERVDIYNPHNQYYIDIKITEHSVSEVKNFANMIAGAATLFVVPLPQDRKFTMNTFIRSKNKLIKKYSHTISGREQVSLYESPEKIISRGTDALTSYLFSDLEKDKILLK